MRLLLGAVVVAWLTGCASSNQVVCPGGDGTVCPEGTACAQVTLVATEDPVTLCVTAGQLEACASDDSAGKACEIGEVMPVAGTCHDHVCLPDDCGNHLVDSTEICDDGNTTTGDGCSSDCRSSEQCGNGKVDPLRGEACDDGNPIGRDGCAATCVAETPAWTELLGARPISRDRYALAFDANRHRTVLFGGFGGQNTPLGGTFEWDGRRWALAPTAVAPAARFQSAMAYDPIRRVSVLFGGSTGGVLADTWEWDGAVWTQRTSAHTPPARARHAMAYDSTRKAVVLFGGATQATVLLQDTWAWNGTDWVEIQSAMKPTARASHAMAYDAKRDVTVMFGGANNGVVADLWELSAAGWTKPAPVGPAPAARAGHAMAFDGAEVLVTAGTGSAADLRDTWTWNGTRWLARVDFPEIMHGVSAVFDAPRGRTVVVSTATGSTGVAFEWTGAAWTTPLGSASIVRERSRSGHIAVLIPPRRHVLIFGGDDDVVLRTWTWDGDWHSEVGAAVPTPARNAAAAYDAQLDRVVMFGGLTKAGLAINDTWLWTGTTWVAGPTGAGVPPAREEAAMAYDPVRHQIVMFGGANGPVALGDTWLWNSASSTWTQGPAAGPSPRRGAAMAFDPLAQKIVLFGGLTMASGASAETWEWNGTSWTQAITPIAPVGRTTSGLAWDAARRRLVLFGGRVGGGVGSGSLAGDTWETTRDPMTGALAWTQVVTEGAPAPRSGHALVSGLDGSGVLVIAGLIADTPMPVVSADAWRLRWSARTPYESCGEVDSDGDGLAGCADPDCWASCTPLCAPTVTSCDPGPRCGDGVCNADLESCYLCPGDCMACAAVCGDFTCQSSESHASCPGDCP